MHRIRHLSSQHGFSSFHPFGGIRNDSLDISTGGVRYGTDDLNQLIITEPDDFKELEGTGFDFHPFALVVNLVSKQHTWIALTGDLAQQTGYDILAIQNSDEFCVAEGLGKHWATGRRVQWGD